MLGEEKSDLRLRSVNTKSQEIERSSLNVTISKLTIPHLSRKADSSTAVKWDELG